MAEDIDFTSDWEAVTKNTGERKVSPRQLMPGEMLEKIHLAVHMLSYSRNPNPATNTTTSKVVVYTYLHNGAWYADIDMPALTICKVSDGKNWADAVAKLHTRVIGAVQNTLNERAKEIEVKEREIEGIKTVRAIKYQPRHI